MACRSREISGHCGHFQCPYPDESGYQCVEVAYTKDRGYCEAGLCCVEKCDFSFFGRQEDDANRAFESLYPEDR